MPVPGPRTQERPVGGYTNPDHEAPDRINSWDWPDPIAVPGRSPALMRTSLRGQRLGAGQVRRFWRQTVQYFAASAGYSWTRNAPAPGREVSSPGAYMITRALRYMTRSVYHQDGTDNSRFAELHTIVHPKARGKAPSTGAGQTRSRPTARNRLASFGSRVPTLNLRVPAAKRNWQQPDEDTGDNG